MRRLFSQLRLVHLVVAAVLLACVAWLGARYGPDLNKSPFVLWDFRAGMRFAALDDIAFRQTRRRFACHEPMRRARLCELHTAGIPGVIRVLVDDAGRVARLQFQPDTSSPVMREEGRRLAAVWNQVQPGSTDAERARDAASTTRWGTSDHRWAALMSYGRLGKTPFDIELTDRRRLKEVAKNSTLAPTVLVLNAVAESSDVVPMLDDVTYALRSIRSGRAMEASYETPVPASYVLLPACERVRLQLGANTVVRDLSFSPAQATLLERATAKAYGGSRLVLGESAWLVDASELAERVRLEPSDGEESEGMLAVAVQYPSRAGIAMVRLRGGRPEAFCRATAEVLIVQAEPNGELRNVYRIPVGEDAVASHISRIEIVPRDAAGHAAQVRIRYSTTLGTYRWMGSVDWEGVIAGDPPRLLSRVPLGFEQITDEESQGRAGTLIMTARSAKSISLGTLEQFDWGFATRAISVPVARNGALDAVRMLDRLF